MMKDNKLANYLRGDKEYFDSNVAAITAQNNRMLRGSCVVYACVLLVYTIMSIVLKQAHVVHVMYYVFDAIHVVLSVVIFSHLRKHGENPKMTQLFCVLFEVSLLAFFALEGALGSKTEHSLYVPIALLLSLLLFIHRAPYSFGVTIVYVTVYASLACVHKEPSAYINDLYIAAATLISAVIGYAMIAKIRRNESEALQKYEHLSMTDQLTGLLNKFAIERECQRMVTEIEKKCAFIILDLDNFKNINDVYGHYTGDDVLSRVGHTLKLCFRKTDHIGRFGGDEFVVLMEDCDDLEIVKERVVRMIKGVSSLTFDEVGLSVNCSAGVALRKEDESFESMFQRADRALYDAKSAGKGTYRISE